MKEGAPGLALKKEADGNSEMAYLIFITFDLKRKS